MTEAMGDQSMLLKQSKRKRLQTPKTPKSINR